MNHFNENACKRQGRGKFTGYSPHPFVPSVSVDAGPDARPRPALSGSQQQPRVTSSEARLRNTIVSSVRRVSGAEAAVSSDHLLGTSHLHLTMARPEATLRLGLVCLCSLHTAQARGKGGAANGGGNSWRGGGHRVHCDKL